MAPRNKISRRDFMNGVAIGVAGGVAASGLMSPIEAAVHIASPNSVKGKTPVYPPRLTGMRGNHPGSFEVAHQIAWDGKKFPKPDHQTDDTYDLVVVGGGISGLSAAFLYQQKVGKDAKILILDNHDDFGGHAKRNEFDVDGHKLISFGGSETMEGPSSYSSTAKKLLRDVGIDVQKFYQYYDQKFLKKWNLESSIYFSKDNFGTDQIIPDPFSTYGDAKEEDIKNHINSFPVSENTKSILIKMLSQNIDYLAGKSIKEKISLLKSISYVEFLKKYVEMPSDGTDIIQEWERSNWGNGWDVMSALEGFRSWMPGTYGLGISHKEVMDGYEEEPYIFHFPDGNAGIARSLVRKLNPSALPGNTMEDLTITPVDYGELDKEGSPIKIRLNSMAIDVKHTDNKKSVDVTYVKGENTYRVRGKHVILACYNHIIPHICKEVPDKQVEALQWPEKTPLVYISIALRNWKALAKLGVHKIFIPKAELVYKMHLDYPVSIGDYKFSANPENPIILHGVCSPSVQGEGYTPREQNIIGRQKIYETSFEDFEKEIYNSLNGALGPSGFNADRDIAAITVSRWPHGYSYEYNELHDPEDWSYDNGPHVTGRAQIGRISIANSDSEALAYVTGAINAAARAVDEQLKM